MAIPVLHLQGFPIPVPDTGFWFLPLWKQRPFPAVLGHSHHTWLVAEISILLHRARLQENVQDL